MKPRLITVAEAAAHGITRDDLAGKKWQRLAPATYAPAELAGDPLLRLAAAMRRLPPSAAFSGQTAAWTYKSDLPWLEPIEATIPRGPGSTARSWLKVRRAELSEEEVVIRQGLRVTSVPRTLSDLARVLPVVEAVVLADAFLHEKLTTVAELDAYAAARVGNKGAVARRRVLVLCEPAAESPMETRLRLLLELNGLPRPLAQAVLRDRFFRFIARVDLYYPEQRLAIEFDGGVHRDTLVEDNRRQNRILAAGYNLLRFTTADVRGTPDAVVAQVRQALLSTKPPR